jgi:hypothetical protein
MKHSETLPKNRLAGILGMGFITFLMLAIFLAWGHMQGRSNQIIDLYFASCKIFEQGLSTFLSICGIDRLPLL